MQCCFLAPQPFHPHSLYPCPHPHSLPAPHPPIHLAPCCCSCWRRWRSTRGSAPTCRAPVRPSMPPALRRRASWQLPERPRSRRRASATGWLRWWPACAASARRWCRAWTGWAGRSRAWRRRWGGAALAVLWSPPPTLLNELLEAAPPCAPLAHGSWLFVADQRPRPLLPPSTHPSPPPSPSTRWPACGSGCCRARRGWRPAGRCWRRAPQGERAAWQPRPLQGAA